MLIGTLLRDCSRRVAVTVTSCRPPVSAVAAGGVSVVWGSVAGSASTAAGIPQAIMAVGVRVRTVRPTDACIAISQIITCFETDPFTEQERCHAFGANNGRFRH